MQESFNGMAIVYLKLRGSSVLLLVPQWWADSPGWCHIQAAAQRPRNIHPGAPPFLGFGFHLLRVFLTCGFLLAV